MGEVCAKYSRHVKISEMFSKAIMTKYKMLWILSTMIVFLSIMSQNYTVNQYARAASKLTIMQVSDCMIIFKII